MDGGHVDPDRYGAPARRDDVLRTERRRSRRVRQCRKRSLADDVRGPCLRYELPVVLPVRRKSSSLFGERSGAMPCCTPPTSVPLSPQRLTARRMGNYRRTGRTTGNSLPQKLAPGHRLPDCASGIVGHGGISVICAGERHPVELEHRTCLDRRTRRPCHHCWRWRWQVGVKLAA